MNTDLQTVYFFQARTASHRDLRFSPEKGDFLQDPSPREQDPPRSFVDTEIPCIS